MILVFFLLMFLGDIVVIEVIILVDEFGVAIDGFELPDALALRERGELHVDVTPGLLRLHIDVGHRDEILLDLLHEFEAQLLVSHLAAAELKLHAHLVPFGEEVLRMNHLDEVIMRIDANTELEFFEFAGLLMLVRLLLVFLESVLVLAVVDELANWRLCIRSHFHQVHAALLRHTDGLWRGNYAELFVRGAIHHANLGRADTLVDTCLVKNAAWRAVSIVVAVATTATSLIGTIAIRWASAL